MKLQLTPHQIMCITGFSYLASSSVATPILSIYIKDVLNAPIEHVGVATSIFFLISALTKIFVGPHAGGIKTLKFYLIAFTIYIICPAFYPSVNNVIWLIVLRSVQGFATAFIDTASLILAPLAVSIDDRDKGVGSYTASLSLGLLAGPAITTLSLPLFGIANTFYFSSLIGLIGISSLFYLNRKISSIEEEWQIMDLQLEREKTRSKIGKIFRNRMYNIAFIGNFSFLFLLGLILAYAPLHAKENLYFTDNYVSILFLLYYFSTTVIRFLVGRIVTRIRKPLILILGISSASIISLALSSIMDQRLFTVLFVSIGVVQGILIPVGVMLITEHIQLSQIALANSLYMIGLDTSYAIAPLITAGVVVRYGLRYSFIVSAVILVFTTLLIIWLQRADLLKKASEKE